MNVKKKDKIVIIVLISIIALLSAVIVYTVLADKSLKEKSSLTGSERKPTENDNIDGDYYDTGDHKQIDNGQSNDGAIDSGNGQTGSGSTNSGNGSTSITSLRPTDKDAMDQILTHIIMNGDIYINSGDATHFVIAMSQNGYVPNISQENGQYYVTYSESNIVPYLGYAYDKSGTPSTTSRKIAITAYTPIANQVIEKTTKSADQILTDILMEAAPHRNGSYIVSLYGDVTVEQVTYQQYVNNLPHYKKILSESLGLITVVENQNDILIQFVNEQIKSILGLSTHMQKDDSPVKNLTYHKK